MTTSSLQWGDVGPSVALLHCSLARAAAWAPLAAQLADRYSLHAADVVGHGAAPDWDPAQDYHDQATAHALETLPGGSSHVVGHSFGATIALRLAIEHPTRVRSLTLIEPVLFAAAKGGAGWREERARMSGVHDLIEAEAWEDAARAFLAAWGGRTPFDAIPKVQADYMVARIGLIKASSPALDGDRADLLPRLGRVQCPVLLMQGEMSPPVIDEIQSALSKALPTAARCTIPDAGHMAPLSRPSAVARALASFWDDQNETGNSA